MIELTVAGGASPEATPFSPLKDALTSSPVVPLLTITTSIATIEKCYSTIKGKWHLRCSGSGCSNSNMMSVAALADDGWWWWQWWQCWLWDWQNCGSGNNQLKSGSNCGRNSGRGGGGTCRNGGGGSGRSRAWYQ